MTSPRPERAVLHAGTLVVIKKSRQGVIRVLGIGPYVHGPLGGIIAVKLLLFHRSALNAPGLFRGLGRLAFGFGMARS